MIKFSLLHVSRGRPQLAFETCKEWFGKAEDPSVIEYLIGLDDDDPAIPEYRRIFSQLPRLMPRASCSLIIAKTRNIPSAMNNLGFHISDTSEILIGVSDDLGSHHQWDTLLLESSRDISNFTVPRYFGINDGLHDFGSFVIYVANRAFYERLGWILYPEYDGLFADSDISQVARGTGWVFPCPHITFQHRHYESKDLKVDMDATYRRHNNDESLKRNMEIFERRKARNFEIDLLLRS